MSDLPPPIVIDSGTQEWRAGVATGTQPEVRLEPSLENLEGVSQIKKIQLISSLISNKYIKNLIFM